MLSINESAVRDMKARMYFMNHDYKPTNKDNTMSLLNKIKQDRIDAMKSKYKQKVDLLGVILGEATKQTKEPSDDMILKVLKNNITTTQEVIKTLNRQLEKHNTTMAAQDGYCATAEALLEHMNRCSEIQHIEIAVGAAKNELNLLTPYLPADISVHDIRTFVDEKKAAGEDDFGTLMKLCKAKWGQSVDMKVVSQIIKG